MVIYWYALQVAVLLTLLVVTSQAHRLCWSTDCDNKLRECAKHVKLCYDHCHHAFAHKLSQCEGSAHGTNVEQHNQRSRCHDESARGILIVCNSLCNPLNCTNPDPNVPDSSYDYPFDDLPLLVGFMAQCKLAHERKCFQTCPHSHA